MTSIKHDETLKKETLPGSTKRMNNLKNIIFFLRSRGYKLYSYRQLERKYLEKLRDCGKSLSISPTQVTKQQYETYCRSLGNKRNKNRNKKVENTRQLVLCGKESYQCFQKYNGILTEIDQEEDVNVKCQKYSLLAQTMKQDFQNVQMKFGNCFWSWMKSCDYVFE